jgi:hypothetical protein
MHDQGTRSFFAESPGLLSLKVSSRERELTPFTSPLGREKWPWDQCFRFGSDEPRNVGDQRRETKDRRPASAGKSGQHSALNRSAHQFVESSLSAFGGTGRGNERSTVEGGSSRKQLMKSSLRRRSDNELAPGKGSYETDKDRKNRDWMIYMG